MKQARGDIIEFLKQAGCRVTKARISLIKVLQKNHQPKSIRELATLVSSDEASVYRNLNLFLTLGLVEEVALSGRANAYALLDHHHHHIVCTNCQLVLHLTKDKEPTIPSNVPGFAKILDHELTYYGLCSKCA